MGKFDFVNQDFQKLKTGGQPKQFTYLSDRPRPRKVSSLKKYGIAVGAVFVLVSVLASLAILNSEKEEHVKPSSPLVPDGEHATAEQDDGGQITVNAEASGKPGIKADFSPETLPYGNETVYKLNVRMPKENVFQVNALLDIKNNSDGDWMTLRFYMYPNQLGEQAREICRKRGLTWAIDKCLKELGGGNFKIDSVKYNGKEIEYVLTRENLELKLPAAISSGKAGSIELDYSFSFPKALLRDGSYQLLQWYPMLADYRNGWEIHPHVMGEDTYTTVPSRFELAYDLQKDFQVISSGVDREGPTRKGTITVADYNELDMVLASGPVRKEGKAGEVDVRVFAPKTSSQAADAALDAAVKAVVFFEKRLGKYPYGQLDIVIGTGKKRGSYPGLIILPERIEKESSWYLEIEEPYEHAVVHQIAQQWFYGPVQFNRFNDLWLSKGMSELAAALYFHESEGKSEKESFDYALRHYEVIKPREDKKANQPADSYIAAILGTKGHVQAKPAIIMWERMKPFGKEMAFPFLSDYLKTYSGQKISTIEFIRFMKAYYSLPDKAFTDWLEYKPYADEGSEILFKL